MTLIDAILESRRAHYIDLSPSDENYKVFLDRSEQIEGCRHTFILDAGFEPGLPGLRVYHLLTGAKDVKNVTIEAIYRDPNIPDGGIKDIIGHNQQAKEWKNNQWKKVSFIKMKIIKFPHCYGKALGRPITTPEIENISKIYKLNNLIYFHAGINGMANAIMFAWQKVFRHFLSIHFGIARFKQAI